ncbi:hypothetical protein [Bacillus solimangrovi]|uniref:Sporulation protein n=1 Tax=Bacillus solimangrovi TaxID=1305675 RepID=A0A1E5LGU1_9BACI|nr:hypothetical protein [Bacillus solimangrovi]OEH93297.1 hypothetical protein BFG57_12280 [Bacillus solimangrovi]
MLKYYSYLLIVSIMLLIGACSPNPEKSQLFSNDGMTGVNQENPSYRPNKGTEIYEDQNPNLLNIGERRTQNSIGSSQGMLRSVVNEDERFEAGMIYTNGRKAYVHVHPKEKYGQEDLSKYRAQLNKKLKQAVPRYEVILRVRNQK